MTFKRLIFCCLAFMVAVSAMAVSLPDGKIDINNVGTKEIRSLDISEKALFLLEEYLLYHGEVTSIYELSTIDGMPYEDFLVLKKKLAVFPRYFNESESKIEDNYYKLENMMNDEGTSE